MYYEFSSNHEKLENDDQIVLQVVPSDRNAIPNLCKDKNLADHPHFFVESICMKNACLLVNIMPLSKESSSV